ncbi:MAG TPA: hypothetical protein VF807_07150 [Ktedonobacterales bacterium]
MRDRRRAAPDEQDAGNPYRSYSSYTASRLPASVGPARRGSFALFHDGNAGHFWRGELFSIIGEALLATGLIIWLADLTDSPGVIATVVAMYALPWIVAGPLASFFQKTDNPGPTLRFLGVARAVLAVGFIAMHFITIWPVLYLLVLGISLLGRLRQGMREAASRLCLAPGESAVVANDLHIGGAVASVGAPLLATLLYIALGERVILVAGVAALFFFLASNSDGFLDPLPPMKREFLLATVDDAVTSARQREELLAAASSEGLLPSARHRRDDSEDEEERALPEWMQVIPSNPIQEIADIRLGLGLAGGRPWSRTSLLILAALSLVGSGIAVLEVFYLIYWVSVPALYLGPLVAAEAAGMALGATISTTVLRRGGWRTATVVGLATIGVGLILLANIPLIPLAFVAALVMGLGNALAVQGARLGARRGLAGPGQRAVTAAEGFITGLCGVAGAGIFAFIYAGPSILPTSLAGALSSPSLQNTTGWWSLGEVLLGVGVALLLGAIISAIQLVLAGTGDPTVLPPTARVKPPAVGLNATGRVSVFSRALRTDDTDDDYDDYDSREYESRELDSRRYDSRW